MVVKVEQIEKNKVLLEVTVEVKEVSSAFNRIVRKVGADINIPGFRKGKAPRNIVEKYVGKEYLKNEVLDSLVNPALYSAYREKEILPVARPSIDIVQLEDGQDLIFKATVEVKPEVELGQYTGLEVPLNVVDITDEQVQEELKHRQDSYAKLINIEEGEVAAQDVVTIDYEGFKDGLPFADGEGENYELTIGSGDFIPGFEEQLIGATPGQELELKAHFPDDYHSADLAGRDEVLKVKVKSIRRKEIAPLDDEFAKDISEFETLDELKADIKQKMQTTAQDKAVNDRRSEILKRVIDNAILEIPEGMLQERVDSMVQEFRNNLYQQGLTLEQYSEYVGQEMDNLLENYRIQANESIKTDLVMEAIAKKEGITVSDEDLENEIKKLSARYDKPTDEIKSIFLAEGQIEWFKAALINERTLDFLVEKNKSEIKDIEE